MDHPRPPYQVVIEDLTPDTPLGQLGYEARTCEYEHDDGKKCGKPFVTLETNPSRYCADHIRIHIQMPRLKFSPEM